MAKSENPFRWFDSSPELIQLAVMIYVKCPLSLGNVEALLHERGIDTCQETVRKWWDRFGPMFAAEISPVHAALACVRPRYRTLDWTRMAQGAASAYRERMTSVTQPQGLYRRQTARGLVAVVGDPEDLAQSFELAPDEYRDAGLQPAFEELPTGTEFRVTG